MLRACKASIDLLAATRKRVTRDNAPRYCGIPNCARPHTAMNLCRAHYQKAWKALGPAGYKHTPYPQPDYAQLAVPKVGRNHFTSKMIAPCVAPGCNTRNYSRGFCQKHYMAWYRQNRLKNGLV